MENKETNLNNTNNSSSDAPKQRHLVRKTFYAGFDAVQTRASKLMQNSPNVLKVSLATMSQLVTPAKTFTVNQWEHYGDRLLAQLDEKLDKAFFAIEKNAKEQEQQVIVYPTEESNDTERLYVVYWQRLKEKFVRSHWYSKVDEILCQNSLVQAMTQKLMHPAEVFYNTVTEVFMQHASIESFMNALKGRLGPCWDERLTTLARAFYSTAKAVSGLVGAGKFVGGALQLGKYKITNPKVTLSSHINTTIEDLLAKWDQVLGVTDQQMDRWFPERRNARNARNANANTNNDNKATNINSTTSTPNTTPQQERNNNTNKDDCAAQKNTNSNQSNNTLSSTSPSTTTETQTNETETNDPSLIDTESEDLVDDDDDDDVDDDEDSAEIEGSTDCIHEFDVEGDVDISGELGCDFDIEHESVSDMDDDGMDCADENKQSPTNASSGSTSTSLSASSSTSTPTSTTNSRCSSPIPSVSSSPSNKSQHRLTENTPFSSNIASIYQVIYQQLRSILQQNHWFDLVDDILLQNALVRALANIMRPAEHLFTTAFNLYQKSPHPPSQVNLNYFISKIKTLLGDSWNDRLIEAMQLFYRSIHSLFLSLMQPVNQASCSTTAQPNSTPSTPST